ncbi:MAG: WD40 repeat domain-containing protein, partial [Planctomycetales bacterium]|nr:WD40 repeat domain-containing protein [Planctomycetales bacterium]
MPSSACPLRIKYFVWSWCCLASCLWAEDGAAIPQFEFVKSQSHIVNYAFSPKGDYVASASPHGKVSIQETNEARLTKITDPTPLLDDLNSDRFDQRERAYLQLASLGRQVQPLLRERLESPPSFEVRRRIEKLLDWIDESTGSPHQRLVTQLRFATDGRILASGSLDKTVRLWNPQTHQIQARFGPLEEEVTALDIASGWIAVGDAGNNIYLYDRLDRSSERLILTGHKATIRGLCLTKDESILFSAAGFDARIGVWKLPPDGTQPSDQVRWLTEHKDAVMCLAYSPQKNRLASGGYENQILIWDVNSLQVIRRLNEPQSTVRCVCFSPDGSLLAACGDDKVIRLWNTRSWTSTELDRQMENVQHICFSPGGDIFLSVNNAGECWTWAR